MADIKLIKRYANRRLYDAQTSKTITLDDVAESIKAGQELKIIDNMTGIDITAKVLAQTFIKVSLEQKNLDFSIFLLTALIRDISNNASGLFVNLMQGGIGSGLLDISKIEKIVQSMVDRGDLTDSDKGNYIENIFRQIQENQKNIGTQMEEGLGFIRREFLSFKDRQIDDISNRLDDMARLIRSLKETPAEESFPDKKNRG